MVNPFLISVDFKEINGDTQKQEVAIEIERMRNKLGLRDEIICVGIERFDYTKGIPERFKAIDRFLEKYPQYEKKIVFIQAGVTNRIHIEIYQTLNQEIVQEVERINWKYKSGL